MPRNDADSAVNETLSSIHAVQTGAIEYKGLRNLTLHRGKPDCQTNSITPDLSYAYELTVTAPIQAFTSPDSANAQTRQRSFGNSHAIYLCRGIDLYKLATRGAYWPLFELQLSAARRISYSSRPALPQPPPHYFRPRQFGRSSRCHVDATPRSHVSLENSLTRRHTADRVPHAVLHRSSWGRCSTYSSTVSS
jgi:hypothetical protein